MKGVIIGQAFMIPSYALIVAGIANSEDMTAFLILMGLSVVAAGLALAVGRRWVDRRYPA